MKTRKFKQVDVFTARPYGGNPVAVVLEAEGLSPDEMQQLAAWTNLSETTFVLPPTHSGADYRLRIFSPKGEIPFAGHPTLGSAHAILESGIVRPKDGCMVQECGAGLLPIRIVRSGGEQTIFAQAPAAKISPVEGAAVEHIRAALGAALAPDAGPIRVDVGAVWLVAQLDDPAAIHTIQPDMAAVIALSQALDTVGIVAFALTGRADYQVYTRAFAPAVAVPEDPVCGSGNASVGAFLSYHHKLDLSGREYIAHQGQEVGRNGVIHVRVSPADGSIEIGGSAVTCIDGTVKL